MSKELDIGKLKFSIGGMECVPTDTTSFFMTKAEGNTEGHSCVVLNMTPQPTIGPIEPVPPMTIDDVLALERDIIATIGIECPFSKGSKIGVSDDGWVVAGHGRTDVDGEFHDVVVTETHAIKFNGKWCWEVRYE